MIKTYLVTFRSVTYAQRAERLLKSHGYSCEIRRTPRWLEEQGCGYSLRIRTEDAAGAARLLTQAQLPMRKIFEQRPDGGLEELVL